MIGEMDTDPGIVPRTIEMLFSQFEEKPFGYKYKLSFSMFEIYNNKLYDLLKKSNKATVQQDMINMEIAEKDEFFRSWANGMQKRKTCSTIGNVSSSRSHAITQLHITVENRSATISLVDLAGSESPNTSENMEETKAINSSLSALINILKGLRRNQTVDFSQCALTEVLKPNLRDGSKTLMIVNLSTEENDITTTMNAADLTQLN